MSYWKEILISMIDANFSIIDFSSLCEV